MNNFEIIKIFLKIFFEIVLIYFTYKTIQEGKVQIKWGYIYKKSNKFSFYVILFGYFLIGSVVGVKLIDLIFLIIEEVKLEL